MNFCSSAICASSLTLVLSACGGTDPTVSPLGPPVERPEALSPTTSAALDTLVEPTSDESLTEPNRVFPLEALEPIPSARAREVIENLDRLSRFTAPPVEPTKAVELSWRDCGVTGNRTVQCAELQVPVDHSNPGGEQLVVAINRISVAPGEERRGSIFYNPGGPGGSGKEIARSLAGSGAFDAIAPGFEVIGFDPRGVGDSSSLECEFIDEYLSGQTGRVATEEDLAETVSQYGLDTVVADLNWLSTQCRSYWGNLFDNLGSNQVVQDIEAIRVAIGDEPLNFLGMSYGTRLGALYAQEYPDHVRAIVLDAAMAPEADLVRQVQAQAEQLEFLHETILVDCESGSIVCPDSPRELFEQMLSDAEALGYRSAVLEVWKLGLAYSFGRSYLPYLLELQATQPIAEWLGGVLALLQGGSTSLVQNFNVNCADSAVPPLSLEEADTVLGQAIERSPLFGSEASLMIACNGWAVEPDPVPFLTAPDAPPLLIVGGTRDQRTPYVWSQELSASIENSVLLTSEHWGHTIVGDQSDCVNSAVRTYLVDLDLPAEGTICPE